jgi:hypothetical protein
VGTCKLTILYVACHNVIYIVYELQLHEYLRESGECGEWIRQQMGTARSQDLGQDYEHLELLLARDVSL